MPLSPPAERELLHLRDIELRGYRRADGLFDIEASLTDTKSFAFSNHDRGVIEPGTPLHRMLARMTIDEDMLIHRFEAATEFGPYAVCPAAAPGFAALAGLTIGRGFLRTANERIGGIKGCTHLRELLAQMATVAFQTMYGQRRRKQGASAASLLNTCLAYAEGGEVARRTWPELHADGAPAAVGAGSEV
ncbi:MAG: DUF2889 domain-containing protein [Acetobacteraceae bacterium]